MDKTIEPTIVTSLADIQNVIVKYRLNDAPGQDSTISTEIVENIDGVEQKSSLKAEVKSYNYRKLIIEGFDIIKNRMQFLEKCQNRTLVPLTIDGHMWVDDIIEKIVGGKRDGLSIIWDTRDGVFRWDPYTTKLTKVNS